jgi:hypothetical protein
MKANVRAEMATPERRRWVRFALVLMYVCVCAAEGAVGRNRREGRASVERLYDTPYLEVSKGTNIGNEWELWAGGGGH